MNAASVRLRCLAERPEEMDRAVLCRIIEKEEYRAVAEMETFIQRHPASHFLQLPQWAGVKQSWQWRGILAYRGRHLVGAMSVLIRQLPLGKSILYCPRGPVCDRNDRMVLEGIVCAVKALADAWGGVLILLDPDEPYENAIFREHMLDMGFLEKHSDSFGNIQAQHVLRLPLAGRTEENVFGVFCSKTRYNIRLARRRNVQIRRFRGDIGVPEEALEAFSALMGETGHRDGFCIRDRAYFERVLSSLGREAALFLAYLDGEPIAGTIGVFSGGKGWYLYGASSSTHRNVMPNYLLQWEMIRYAMKQSCVFYDFRGVPGNPSENDPLYGLYRFKKGFSGNYTKFVGLFVYRCRPVIGDALLAALKCFRKLRGWTMRK